MWTMRTNWMGAISLVLSAITLAVVLSVAARPAPQSVDPGPALGGLRSDVSQLRTDIAALRAIVEQPAATANVDQLGAIQVRLDSLDSAVGGIATKFTALCNAINSSPFSPQGGAC
jgi:hypothetical protein